MGYSINDIKNATSSSIRSIEQKLDQRSQERGEAIANQLISRTSQGRGLWCLMLWPVWLLLMGFSSVTFMHLIQKYVAGAMLPWIGIIFGFFYARAWYMSKFTIDHPFWSSVLFYFGTVTIALSIQQSF